MIILFSGCRNSTEQGLIGLSEAINYFIKQHYTVCLPLVDAQDFDLVVMDASCSLFKIQVKTTNNNVVKLVNGSSWDVRKVKLNSDKVYDFLFVVVGCGAMYLIPKPAIDQKHSLTLGASYQRYKVVN